MCRLVPNPEEHLVLIPLWPFYGEDEWCWEIITKPKIILMMAKSNVGSPVLSAAYVAGYCSMYACV